MTSIRPPDPDSTAAQELRRLAAEASAAGDVGQMLQHYDRAVELLPDDPDLLCGLGEALYAVDRLPEAEARFRAALERDHNHSGALKGLGFTIQAKGDDAGAIYYYLRYLEHDDKHADVLSNLGAAFHNTGDYPRALRYYGKAEKLDPDNPRIPENRGRALFAQGKLDQAIPSLRRAVRLDPSNSEVRSFLGSILMAAGRPGEALHELEEAIALDPENANARLDAAIILDQSDPEAGLKHAEEAARLFEAKKDGAGLISAYANLGWLYYRTNRLDDSIEMSRRAVNLDPALFASRFNLALALLANGKRLDAEREYREGLEVVPLASDLKLHAIADLEEALRRNPDLPGGSEILRELRARYAAMKRRLADRSHPSSDVQAIHDALAAPSALMSNLPQGTFILAMAVEVRLAKNSPEARPGILTRHFVEGLAGSADLNSDGVITVQELGKYVQDRVHHDMAAMSRPAVPAVFSSNRSSGGDLILRGRAGVYPDIAGVIVGLSHVQDASELPALPSSQSDAAHVYNTLKGLNQASPGLRLLVDSAATRSAIARAVEDAAGDAQPETLVVFYFTGHSFLAATGEVSLVAFDSRLSHPELIPLESVKAAIERSTSRNHLLVLDTMVSRVDDLERGSLLMAPPSP